MQTREQHKKFCIFLISSVVFAIAGCAGFTPTASYSTKLMLYGGPGNDTYLGCISCSQYAYDSIFNAYGVHGSRYAVESIWNRFGRYGSPFSSYSPWNRFASASPIIVDEYGNYYGRFTIRQYDPERTRIPSIREFLESCNGMDVEEIYEQVHENM